MIICKNLNQSEPIITIDDWKRLCPPQKKDEHWKDGRSAKETAKLWINGAPVEYLDTIKPLKVCSEIVSPEYVSYFDKNGGNGRNHDLLILDTANKIVVGIESKVDEAFDKTVEKRYYDAIIDKDKNKDSLAKERVEELIPALFNQKLETISQLKYQLLTSVAGTIAEAKKKECKKAVFLVQTFISQQMNSKRHRQNQLDLDYFVEIISNGMYKIIHDGDLLHIGTLPGNEFIPKDVDLYIGKYSIRL
ncbi:MAG: hypothetical protein KIT33_10390 [Candidatus Kapabacteria bacterium]|nr:hypothetical protein [Ignavibacteriota bacterium]MCW5885367.1 hypothetical protein [Candidatus Kapabacteria bacterium]